MRNIQTEETGLQKFMTWKKRQVSEAYGSHSNSLHCALYIDFLKTFSITGNACIMAKAFFNHGKYQLGRSITLLRDRKFRFFIVFYTLR